MQKNRVNGKLSFQEAEKYEQPGSLVEGKQAVQGS